MSKMTETKLNRAKMDTRKSWYNIYGKLCGGRSVITGFEPPEPRELKTFAYSNGKKIEIRVAKGQIINPMKLYKKHFPSSWD